MGLVFILQTTFMALALISKQHVKACLIQECQTCFDINENNSRWHTFNYILIKAPNLIDHLGRIISQFIRAVRPNVANHVNIVKLYKKTVIFYSWILSYKLVYKSRRSRNSFVTNFFPMRNTLFCFISCCFQSDWHHI